MMKGEHHNTIAFVLSGGGSRGALQVGALQVLLEAGVRPDLLVGASAGALNAAFLATDPTPVGARRLGEIWQQVTKEDVYPGGPLRVAWHLLTRRDSLYPSDNFRAFLEANAPPRVRFFHQLAVPLYITATDLRTGRLYLFGEDPEASVLDAVMASVSVPLLHPPWRHRGRLLVDGGVAANLPVGVAVEKGATEVYALEVWGGQAPQKACPETVEGSHWNLWEIAVWSIGALMRQQWERDLALCAVHPEVTLHHLPLYTERPLAFDDFSQAAELVAEGREAAEAYLAAQGLPQAVSEKAPVPGWKRAFHQVGGGIEWLWQVLMAQIRQRMGTHQWPDVWAMWTGATDKRDLILNKWIFDREAEI